MIRLTRRERLLSAALVTFVVVVGLLAFVVKPAIDRMKTLTRVIPEKQTVLNELRTKSYEYVAMRDSLEGLHKKVMAQDDGFELLPFLESLTRERGLAEKVATMKQQVLQLEPDYCETVVEIELQNLTLGQLVDFLWKVESSNVLARTKSLYIKRNRANTDLLDSVIEIHSVKLVRN